jgi:hypothetical protein
MVATNRPTYYDASMSWRDHAACIGHSEVFFTDAEPRTPEYNEATTAARRICAGCGVQPDCYQWAITDRGVPRMFVIAGMLPGQLVKARRKVHAKATS